MSLDKYSELEGLLKRRLKDAKYRAGQKKIPFSITLTDLWERYKLQGGSCFYTQEPMLTYSPDSDYSLSLDRINSDGGYTKDNICLCFWYINKMKAAIPQNDFINICAQIANNHRRTNEQKQ